MKRYVIIGNGVAAVGCIEGIRSLDREGDITVISEEDHPVYSRPLISYLLQGRTDTELMKYRPDGFYEENGCRVRYGRRASAIDAVSHTVTLDDGGKIAYDCLCVAAGSRPFVPPFEGLDTVKCRFSFMTLDDALALGKALTPETRVLIVGAGLIGLKCAEGIRDRVGSITVCDLADRVLSSILDTECAAVVQKHLETNGISFMLGDTVQRFEENRAFMKSGASVDFDLLVLAVGVRANTGLVKNAGGEKQTLDEAYRFFSGAPGNLILALLAFLLMYFILNYTKIGTYCSAIGSNEFTAKNMGINVKKYKLIGFMLLHFFVGIMAILSVSYGTTMTALTEMSTMSRNFQPLMGTFFGVAFKKYGMPIPAIVVGEFIISMIFNGFVALGAPTTIQKMVTGAALLIIVTLTARGGKGSVVK